MILCLLPETLSPREMKILKGDPQLLSEGDYRFSFILHLQTDGLYIIQEEPEKTKPRTLKLIFVLLEDYNLNSVTNK